MPDDRPAMTVPASTKAAPVHPVTPKLSPRKIAEKTNAPMGSRYPPADTIEAFKRETA